MDARLYTYQSLRVAGISRAWIRQGTETRTLRRVRRGIYSGPGSSDPVTAAFLRLPATAVLGFQSGAAAHGFGIVSTDRIHVIVPAETVVPRLAGVVAHEAVLPIEELVLVGGVPCAPAARCAVDLARTLRRMDALPVLDAALRSGACDPTGLELEILRHAGLRGVRQARELVPLADGRAECRQESQMRLVLIDGGLPPPTPQLWVRDMDGVPVYRLDLGYEEQRVGIEYDGSSHLERDRMRYDRARLNWLHAHGWRMCLFTDRDLYRNPGVIVGTVRAALDRR